MYNIFLLFTLSLFFYCNIFIIYFLTIVLFKGAHLFVPKGRTKLLKHYVSPIHYKDALHRNKYFNVQVKQRQVLQIGSTRLRPQLLAIPERVGFKMQNETKRVLVRKVLQLNNLGGLLQIFVAL